MRLPIANCRLSTEQGAPALGLGNRSSNSAFVPHRKRWGTRSPFELRTSNFELPARRAVILPVVLFALVMIGLLAASFAFRIHADYSATQVNAAKLQTRLAAEAGIERVKGVLRTSRFDRSMWYNNPEMLNRIIVWANGQDSRIAGTNREIDETMVYRFSIVADDPTDDRDYVRFGVSDESSKLNLNSCTDKQLLHLVTAITQGQQDIDPKALVDAIIDWRDTDSTPRSDTGDTEGKYYESLNVNPYRVKNGPFTTMEELLLVKGVTPQVLYGEDFDGNGLLTPNEDDGDKSFPPDNQDGQLNRGLAPYVSVVSSEPNVANDNRARAYLLGEQSLIRTEMALAFPDDPTKVDYIVNASRTVYAAQQGGGQQGGGQQGGGQQQGDGQQGGGQQGGGQQQGGQQGGAQQGGQQGGQNTGGQPSGAQPGGRPSPQPSGGNPGSGSPSGGLPGGARPPAGGAKPPSAGGKSPGGVKPVGGSPQTFNFIGLTSRVVAGAKVYADDQPERGGKDGARPPSGSGTAVPGGSPRPGSSGSSGSGSPPASAGGSKPPGGGTGQPGAGAPGTPGAGTGDGNDGEAQPQTGGQPGGQQGEGAQGGQQPGGSTGDGQQGGDRPPANEPGKSPAALLFGAKIDGRDTQSPLTPEDLPLLMDRLTMINLQQKKVPGLINVNTAPRLVLECIEGITPEQIEGILAVRDSLDAKTASTTAWLVTEGIMDIHSYDKIANGLTARGQQFTVESLGYSDHQGMVTRLQAIVELNGPMAQTIYYRDVSYLGGHFPIREEDAKKKRRVH